MGWGNAYDIDLLLLSIDGECQGPGAKLLEYSQVFSRDGRLSDPLWRCLIALRSCGSRKIGKVKELL